MTTKDSKTDLLKILKIKKEMDFEPSVLEISAATDTHKETTPRIIKSQSPTVPLSTETKASYSTSLNCEEPS